MTQRLAGRFEARPIAAVNLTPLVPVLLAVFAVIAIAGGSAPSRSLDLAVAPGDPGPLCNACPPPARVMSVKRNGVLFLDEKSVSLGQAERLLRSGDRSNPEVWVRADADVPYAQAFEAMQSVKRAGFRPRLINEDLR